MIFHDLESLLQKTGIPDKYVLAQVVSMRARQLSEQHNRALIDETSGRCINEAVEDIAAGNFPVQVTLNTEDRMHGPQEVRHASLEE